MIIIFVQKFLSVNSNLGQERHGYTCAEVSVTHFFYAKSFIQNYRGVPELFKKPPGVQDVTNYCAKFQSQSINSFGVKLF